MEPIKHALVLTGDVLPGFDAANVWPALAAYFRMEPDRLKAELLGRAPISIKESDDLPKLQKLQAGASAVGAATELQAMGSDDNLFVLVDGVPRGPMPHAYVEDRVRSGAWQSSISVATVGSANWRPFIVPTSPAADFDQQATVAFNTLSPQTVAQAEPVASPAPEMRMSAATPAASAAAAAPSMAAGDMLPEGNIVNAGFWRRVAAYMLDSIILGLVSLVYFAVIAGLGWLASDSPGLAFFIMFLGYIGLIALMWLYFAKFESGPKQATPGKQVMGIKVTDERGNRVSFGRATGRFFGKIVSGMIMNIGYMMAGFTSRKQALHDMMAGCCVVFSEVQPGKPMPTVRPKMPWYGWVLNCLPILGILIMFASWGFIMSRFMGMAASEYGAVESQMSDMDTSGMDTTDSSEPSDAMQSSSGVDEDEAALVRAGMTQVFMVASETQSEVAAIADGGGDCPAEERTSGNNWIESIQIGGIAPECTVTVRLSSSPDIPFAARIERIEWTYANGAWRCESSMAGELLPFDCN